MKKKWSCLNIFNCFLIFDPKKILEILQKNEENISEVRSTQSMEKMKSLQERVSFYP